ncbi:hypothetical protein [Spirochaeta cellobiosiphila]|uniref:hypothetical protein n=1 Tax=Spirochaeta cellobiosiphila TaxID=504483 RepID=UPI0004260A3D|nr:hypothetical protein [Spirochaeta cellobiosiphila]
MCLKRLKISVTIISVLFHISCGLPQDEFIGNPVKDYSKYASNSKKISFIHDSNLSTIGVDLVGYEIFYKIVKQSLVNTNSDYLDNEIDFYDGTNSLYELIKNGKYSKVLLLPRLPTDDKTKEPDDKGYLYTNYNTWLIENSWPSQDLRIVIDFENSYTTDSDRIVNLDVLYKASENLISEYELIRWTNFTFSDRQNRYIATKDLNNGYIKLFEFTNDFIYRNSTTMADDIDSSITSTTKDYAIIFFADSLGRSEENFSFVRSNLVYVGTIEVSY